MKHLNCLIIAVCCSLLPRLEAQTNDNTTPPTNSIIWAAAPVDTPPVYSENTFQDIIFGIGHRLDIGATESVRFTSGLEGAAGVSVLGVCFSHTNAVTATYSAFWQAGVAYTFVPAWTENDIGAGVALDILRLSDSTKTGIAGVVDKVPVVATVAPKLTVLKAFMAAETPVDQITRQIEFRLVAGLSLPMGP